MAPFLLKNPELTPKMPEYSKAILTKSYVDFYTSDYCSDFLELGKTIRVIECGFSEYDFDEKLRQKGLKNNTEWCQIEIMDRDIPPDCYDFFVKAKDLKQIEDPDFRS